MQDIINVGICVAAGIGIMFAIFRIVRNRKSGNGR